MFISGENIYPYYLYPPPSILVFAPMTFFGDSVGRVIWAVINFAMFVRIVLLLLFFLESWISENLSHKKLFILVLFCSMGMIDHNIQLGQMTIYMLWISIEFCYLLNKEQLIKAALLMALGITLKLIPGVFLLWLWVKKKYAALATVIGVILVLAVLPEAINKQFTNQDLWKDWITTVNPLGERFAIETKASVISLNGFLPAFLSEHIDLQVDEIQASPRRNFMNLDSSTVEWILNLFRMALILLLWFFYRNASDRIGIFEISLTLLVAVLIFPHQMKYSMLLFTPAMILVVLKILQNKKPTTKIIFRILNIILLAMFLLFAVYGRDTIGDTLVNNLDHYKFFTWLILFSMIKLVYDGFGNRGLSYGEQIL